MRKTIYVCLLALLAITALSGCGGASSNSGSSSGTTGLQSSGTVSLILNDDPTDDWATIGVKVLNMSLVPQGGGAAVTVYTAPNPAPIINLVQLDDLGDILASATVPAGTYVRAQLTLAANPGDLTLTASASPESGFAGTAGATVPSSQIQMQGTSGTAGNLTVPLTVNFVSPFVVTANQNNVLALDFDLAHPAFLVAHVPPALGTVMWAVNFNGPVRHHSIRDLTRLVLRHLYGSVTSVAADGSTFTMTKLFPVMPATNPETSISGSQSLQILADSANGTIYHNLDAHTKTTLFNFTSLANTLPGKFVRVAARYQANGTLVAVRVWSGSTFQSVWVSPEGHILHVLASSLVVENEDGTPVSVNVNSATQFFFRAPGNAVQSASPIGTGTGFLSNLVRGFKVHVTVADPLQVPLVADTVDIEIARFDGALSSANSTGFTYTRQFPDLVDNYSKALTYISSSTPNDMDPLTGNAITGFKFWLFAFPTIVTSGANAIPDFGSLANGSVNFGGAVGALTAFGQSRAVWSDPAAANNWSIPWVVVDPTPIPLGTVLAPWTTNANGGSFTMQVSGGTNAPFVDASSVSGSATLVYQVDRSGGGIVTISPQDLTTAAGLNNVASHLILSTPVKVYGVPQANGHIKAYVIFYFTGTATVR